MEIFNNVLNTRFGGNTLEAYLTAIVIAAASLIAMIIVKRVVIVRLKQFAKKTAIEFDDFLIEQVEKTLFPLFYLSAIYFGVNYLNLSSFAAKTSKIAWMSAVAYFGIQFVFAIITYFLEKHWIKGISDDAKTRTIRGMVTFVKVIFYGIAVIVLLDNLGIKISALLAGLGIGGVAVALASQAILGDLFSFFIITFDKPFEIGDFIVAGEHMGTVERVGIKTTRLRSVDGEQIIFSNTDLTNSRVKNYKRMLRRRVLFKIGLTYQTGSEQLREMPKLIENVIKLSKETLFDRAHFAQFGDSALIYEVVYYVLSGDYNKYMDIQQEINLRLKEELEKRKIEFAYPTQTLFVNELN